MDSSLGQPVWLKASGANVRKVSQPGVSPYNMQIAIAWFIGRFLKNAAIYSRI